MTTSAPQAQGAALPPLPPPDLVAKLRYMARQYTAGAYARGGNVQRHYLDDATDVIERLVAYTAPIAAERDRLREAVQTLLDAGYAGPHCGVLCATLAGTSEPTEVRRRNWPADHPLFVAERLHALAGWEDTPADQADLMARAGTVLASVYSVSAELLGALENAVVRTTHLDPFTDQQCCAAIASARAAGVGQ